MNVVVLGLGNSLLSDDSIGLKIAQRVGELLPTAHLPAGLEVRIELNEAGGWAIIDNVEGADTLIVVDAIIDPDLAPGHVAWYSKGGFTSPRMAGAHTTDIFTALEFGRNHGLKIPDGMHILGVGVKDVQTFSEECTPEIQPAIERGARGILALLTQMIPAGR